MDFVDDDEKMRDFFLLTKEEFLNLYEYLNEEDYEATRELVKSKRIIELLYIGNDSNDLPVYRSKLGHIYKDISLGKSKNLKNSLYTTVGNEFDGEPLLKANVDAIVKVLNYVPIKEIRGNEDLHKIAQTIKFETDDCFMPEDTKRATFLREIETQIEWELNMVHPGVSRETLIEADRAIMQVKEKEINSFKDKVNNFLKHNKKYDGFNIEYILVDNKSLDKSFIVASRDDEIIKIDPYDMYIKDIIDWTYNFDDDIFQELEEGKEISYMTIDTHYAIWDCLERCYPDDIKNIKGVQIYLKYCKENNITKERIDKETNHIDTPNVMKYCESIKRKNKGAR